MEYPAASNQITVVKVNTICCKSYQKKLKKKLSKLDGVRAININPQENLVRITGRVDAHSLINTISETGKYAEILSLNKNPEKPNCKNSCFPGNNTDNMKDQQRQHQQDYHRRENYVPPMDDHFCSDQFCRHHGRRTMFHDSEFFHGPFDHYPAAANGRDHNPGMPCHSFEDPRGCIII